MIYHISLSRARSFYFSHSLDLLLVFEHGFYSRVDSITASKIMIAIIINTGNSFATTRLTCGHVDQFSSPRFARGASVRLFAFAIGVPGPT